MADTQNGLQGRARGCLRSYLVSMIKAGFKPLAPFQGFKHRIVVSLHIIAGFFAEDPYAGTHSVPFAEFSFAIAQSADRILTLVNAEMEICFTGFPTLHSGAVLRADIAGCGLCIGAEFNIGLGGYRECQEQKTANSKNRDPKSPTILYHVFLIFC